MNDIIIWGTGLLGEIAYHYYKYKCNIICYIDNDERKWGQVLNGIRICSPDILYDYKVEVILAIKNGVDIVRKQLYKNYDIDFSTLFQINEECHLIQKIEFEEMKSDTCIICFFGGLGNQMFQYAYLKNLALHGKSVAAYLELRDRKRELQITNVFKNINLTICTKEQKDEVVKKNIIEKSKAKKFMIFIEENAYEVKRKEAQLSILDITGGVITGLHQTFKFAELIRSELLKDFKFDSNREKKLQLIRDSIIIQNTVSIHIRRGDYLLGNNQWIYGDICTKEYYENAISYLKDIVKDCKYIFFSNDIQWVKEHYKMEKAIYIDSTMFEHYQDWYDMYLMSICKHNIIANSTFSWWGAWLNQNKNKIVIAPKRWVNLCEYKDIYPESWIKM